MVLEANVIVIDNSEYMRNGDYMPTRYEAQADAVNLLFNAKTQSNPENAVGLISMSGRAPEVRVTLTRDFGKILQAMHKVELSGSVQLSTGIQIAQLALKHRQNKSQRQRVIVFVASPIDEPVEKLTQLAKRLKKNNVAVDFVNFGEYEANTPILESFIEAVNSNGNSHLATILPGGYLLSDALLSSAVVTGEDGSVPGGVGSAGADGFDFGDPNMDPDLAMALRLSLEEEQARLEQTHRREQELAATRVAAMTAATEAGPSDEVRAPGPSSVENKMDEDEARTDEATDADGTAEKNDQPGRPSVSDKKPGDDSDKMQTQ